MPNATAIHPDDARALLHAELTDIVRVEIGMNEQFASDMAGAILRGLSRLHGGADLYIPAEDKAQRNAAVRAAFNGRNHADVMRKFGISQSTLYRILGEH